ncbi:MAG: flagellar basal body rod protein [Fibrobacteres bacterium]|nr:flagellar basal body rod protein [Fibrobacterota bacterium]
MDTSFSISSSALYTTGIRHDVTANNVANINTDGFSQSDVIQTDISTGGTRVAAIRKTPNNGGNSNTDFAKEAGEMIQNRNVYGANGKVFKIQNQMIGELLDMVG